MPSLFSYGYLPHGRADRKAHKFVELLSANHTYRVFQKKRILTLFRSDGYQIFKHPVDVYCDQLTNESAHFL